MGSLKEGPLMKRQCAYLLGWHQYMGYDENEEDELSENEETNYPILESNKEIEDYEIKFSKSMNNEDIDNKDVTLEAMEVFDELNPKFAKTCKVCLECLAYAGTGNVLKIQKMLGILGEHFDDEFEEALKKKKEEESKNKSDEDDDDEDDKDQKNKKDDYR